MSYLPMVAASPTTLQPASRAGSFRRAVLVTAAISVAAILAMALALVVGLARADDLLSRLRRSQDQLAQVTRIQGDVERLRADIATGAPDVATNIRRIEDGLGAYRASVQAESAALGRDAGPGQATEALTAGEMGARFEALRNALVRGEPMPVLRARGAFEALADQVVAKERAEAEQASRDMAALRSTVTWLGAAIPLLGVLAGGAGAWLVLAQVNRALRQLEAATTRPADAGVVEMRGFSEFRRLAEAFNRMREEIARQHATLEATNAGLEHEVGVRTAEIEASRQALADIDANRRRFYSKLSHELRTPVTVIRGEAEIALRDRRRTPDQLEDALGIVVAYSDFLERRIEDMLTLARAEDGAGNRRDRPADHPWLG